MRLKRRNKINEKENYFHINRIRYDQPLHKRDNFQSSTQIDREHCVTYQSLSYEQQLWIVST